MSEVKTEIITGVINEVATLTEQGNVNVINTYFSEGTWKFIATRTTETKEDDKPVVFEVKNNE